ncbi:MAG: hypothetical protein AAGD22_07775 [Verrucomicrobiota bacterium]
MTTSFVADRSLPQPAFCTIVALLTLLSITSCHRPPDPNHFNLSLLADPPEWQKLDPFQRSITREDFVSALEKIYSNGPSYKSTIKIRPKYAEITRSTKRKDFPAYLFEFATDEQEATARQQQLRSQATPFWTPTEILRQNTTPAKPLADIHVAIDPGHIGGKWARMEERWFQIGDDQPVEEGTMTLKVAKLLKTDLEEKGATVTLLRTDLEPVTNTRPEDFEDLATRYLVEAGFDPPPASYSNATEQLPGGPQFTVQWQSEKMFYRSQEIRDRARLVNNVIKPDLILCLHMNAEKWGNPARPTLRNKNHYHILCNGTYSLGEISADDQRFEMLLRLVQGIHDEEIPLCTAVAEAFDDITGMPRFAYDGTFARRVNEHPGVFSRNLLATRSYLCPVIFLEPYVMNDRGVYDRIQNAAKDDPSIFQEYADAVTEGLVRYFNDPEKYQNWSPPLAPDSISDLGS